MLDALMGADRNAPVEGASGMSSHSGGGGGGPTRRQKRSCYDPDVCPLYCAWSLSSQEEPTWAESVAANENMGGIDVYDLFTNTKSDIGTNPYRVDDHAREEFAGLPDHEKRRLGYEDMLARKLLDLVRQCDRSVVRNKDKLRREVSPAMKQRTDGIGMGNREDLIVTVNEEMLEKCASSVAQATLIEEDMSSLLEKMEGLEREEEELLRVLAAEETAAAEDAIKEKAMSEEEKQSEPPKKKKKKGKDKYKDKAKDAAAAAEDIAAEVPTAKVVDPRLLELERAGLSEDRFFIHCDGALFGLMMPFVRAAAPLVTFRKPIGSISVSGHKFIGAPMPCGVVMTRAKCVEALSSDVEYLNSRDATIMGSRNGHAPIYMWYTLTRKGYGGMRADVEHCLANAHLLQEMLESNGIKTMLNRLSSTVVFERPPCETFVRKWQLACEGEVAHVVVMPNITPPKLEVFVKDLVECRRKFKDQNSSSAKREGESNGNGHGNGNGSSAGANGAAEALGRVALGSNAAAS